MDESSLLVGENFAARLQEELVRCDGIVFLHTHNSAASEWCRAEVYSANSLGLPLLRVRLNEAPPLPDPMERLLSGVHYLQWNGNDTLPLNDHLTRIRQRWKRTLFRRLTGVFVSTVALIALVFLFLSRWDARQTEQKRVTIVEAIVSSQTMWSASKAEAAIDGIESDSILLGRVRVLQDDPTIVSAVARFNAWQVNQYLSLAQERSERWDLSGINWRDASLKSAFLSDATMRDGDIESLVMDDCTFAGVYFGPGPSANDTGLSFVDANFARCEFWNVWFDGTQFLSTEFRDSKFRGVQLSVQEMAAVRFVTTASNEAVLTPHFALFEDSLITGLSNPPDDDVLDLSEPEHEVIFDSVEFVRVSFSGWFRPSWFRNSHFVDCTFPPNFPLSELGNQGNRIEFRTISN